MSNTIKSVNNYNAKKRKNILKRKKLLMPMRDVLNNYHDTVMWESNVLNQSNYLESRIRRIYENSQKKNLDNEAKELEELANVLEPPHKKRKTSPEDKEKVYIFNCYNNKYVKHFYENNKLVKMITYHMDQSNKLICDNIFNVMP